MSTNQPTERKRPKWTVLYNIVSKESDKWVGTGWEFFDDEADAEKCRARNEQAGHCVVKRPYSETPDYQHLGAAHRYVPPEQRARHDRPATGTAICWLAKHADGKTSFHTTAKLAEATRRERGGTVIPLYAAPPAEGREGELLSIAIKLYARARGITIDEATDNINDAYLNRIEARENQP